MFALFFLVGICLIVSTVAAVWLLVLAFRQSILWGLAVFFLPFANIVFAIKYWHEAKKPFLINVGATVAAIKMFFVAGVAVMMNAAQGEMAMAGNPSYTFDATTTKESAGHDDTKTGSLHAFAQEAAAVRAENNAIQLEPSSPSMAPVHATLAAPAPIQRRVHFGNIPVDQVDDSYVGKMVRVVSTDGLNSTARVTATSPGSISFARDFAGGEVAFDLTRSEIESIEAIRR